MPWIAHALIQVEHQIVELKELEETVEGLQASVYELESKVRFLRRFLELLGVRN